MATNPIREYVQRKNPELGEVIEQLCIDHALLAGESPGVTFLLPDAALTAEIAEKAKTDTAGAEDMVMGLIIPDAFQSNSDFTSRKVGNARGVAFKVKTYGGPGGVVTLVGEGGDLRIRREDSFGPGAYAVWRIESGRPALTGDAYAPPAKGEKKTAAPVRGGADSAPCARRDIAMHIEMCYTGEIFRDRARSCNPYLSAVAGLLQYLRHKQPALHAKALAVVDYSPMASFYLLLEPYKKSGDFLIPDTVVSGPGAWNGARASGNAVEVFLAELGHIPSAADAITKTISVRGGFSRMGRANIVGRIAEIYNVTADGGKKRWQDELRLVLQFFEQRLAAEPDAELVGQLGRTVQEYYPGNDYIKEAQILSGAELSRSASAKDAFCQIVRFINSSAFLYVARPPAEVGEQTLADPSNVNDAHVYNREFDSLKLLKAMTPRVAPVVPPYVLSAVEQFKAEHGTLPPELLALQ